MSDYLNSLYNSDARIKKELDRMIGNLPVYIRQTTDKYGVVLKLFRGLGECMNCAHSTPETAKQGGNDYQSYYSYHKMQNGQLTEINDLNVWRDRIKVGDPISQIF